ncbi:MAG: hypothetical protein D6798_09900 [Deltaproteobacteria bacterium]|nr:MAG: hypothetical protein D6798_09900 [Deltaproteobacteria bacterium]
MTLRPALLASFALVACSGAAPPEAVDGPAASVDSAARVPFGAPTYDLTMTEGYLPGDHVEVAPGVFVLKHLVESGAVRYTDLSPAEGTVGTLPGLDGGAALLPPPVPSPGETGGSGDEGGGVDTGDGGDGGSGPWVPDRDTCYEYDTDSYTDRTRNGSLFGEDPTWYGTATAYSYRSGRYDADTAYTYIYSYSPVSLDYVNAYAYVYINDRYAGYVSATSAPGTSAYAYGSWDAACDRDGTLDVRVSGYHYFYDESSGASLSLRNTVTASVTCCPRR